EDTSAAEASIALFVTAHCSVLSVDHLGVMCSNSFSDSEAAKDHLYRTKCSGIIKNLLQPHYLDDLLNLGSGPFTLILDESTDISTTKLLV
ncbi:hypothetical protein HPB47_028475, partial [Ixodes persulcatus]